MIEKARQDLETNIRSSDKSEWTIEAKLHESQGEPRGERDVIRLRNPTEDKRAFRRMLTSADRIDYSGVAFSKELLEWGRTFSDF